MPKVDAKHTDNGDRRNIRMLEKAPENNAKTNPKSLKITIPLEDLNL